MFGFSAARVKANDADRSYYDGSSGEEAGSESDVIAAINQTQAVIEFSLDGTIRKANTNFLSLMEYTLDEVKGKHHRIFVPTGEADSFEYKKFWQDLGKGIAQTAQFRRVKNQAKMSGSRPPTRRSCARVKSTGSLSLPPMSPIK